MKQVLFVILMGSLVGCGGYHQARRDPPPPQPVTAPIAITPTVVGVTTPGAAPSIAPGTPVVATAPAPQPVRKPSARGPLQKACMASDRRARSAELCGCIQAVANNTLSNAQQRRAVGFYSDPHQAQVVRQSDRQSDELFWEDYREYGRQAQRICG